MNIQQFEIMGHTVHFADDGPYENKPLWKTKIDQGIWSAGHAELATELQETIDDVVSMERGRKIYTNYLKPRRSAA